MAIDVSDGYITLKKMLPKILTSVDDPTTYTVSFEQEHDGEKPQCMDRSAAAPNAAMPKTNQVT